MRKWLALFAVLLAAAVAWFFLRERRPAKPGTPPAGALVVFPFDAREAPQHAWLAEGIVDLLARDLENAPLHAIEPASVLHASRGLTEIDPEHARTVALQLGAKLFARGRIKERRGELAVDATLYDVSSGAPLVEASARGKPEELLRLVRQLSDQLQLRTPDPAGFDAQLADLGRRTSRSPAALQAWLEGEQLLRHAHWFKCPEAFQRAIDADPEFALAFYRLGVVIADTHAGEGEDAFASSLRFGNRLAPTERGLAEALLLLQRGSLSEAQQLLESLTREHPADVESWMRLAEFYFHQGPLLGRSPQEAEGALQRVLMLDPLNAEAIIHLADLAELRGERAVALTLAERVLALVDDTTNITGFRLLRAWAKGDVAEHDAVFATLAPGLPRTVGLTAMIQTAWEMDNATDPLAAAKQVAYADGFQPVAAAALLGGRPELARRSIAEAAAAHPAGDVTYYLPWIDTLELVRVSPEQLARSRAAAARLDETKDSNRAPAKRYLTGLLALRAGDLASAAAAAEALDKMPPLLGSSIASDLALALRARVLAARKDLAGALALLDKQQLHIPMRFSLRYPRHADIFFRASLLEELGRPREALPLYEALDFYVQASIVFLPAANLHRARIYEKLGDTAKAIERYEAFAAMWKECEPEERGLLEEARTRLTALRAAR